MSQATAFGEASIVTYMKVERASRGITEFFRVRPPTPEELEAARSLLEGGAVTEQIDEATYIAEGGQ